MESTSSDIKQKAQDGRAKTYLKTMNMVLNPGGVLLDKGIDKVGSSNMGSAVLDLTPIIGGYKQMREARDGQTTTGKKLEGKERLVHGAVGVGSLLLDATGAGEMSKGSRLVGKSTGFIKGAGEKLAKGGATKSANLLNKSAQLMAENPELVRMAENAAEDHLDDAIKYVKNTSKEDARNTLKKEASEYMPESLANSLVDTSEAKLNSRVGNLRGDRPSTPKEDSTSFPTSSSPTQTSDTQRKSDLQAARKPLTSGLSISSNRTNTKQPTASSFAGPKRTYADPGQFAGKMLPGGGPPPLQQLDLSGMKQKTGDFEAHYADWKATLAQNRFNDATPPSGDLSQRTPKEDAFLDDEPNVAEPVANPTALRIQQTMARRQLAQQQANQASTSGASQQTQEAIKKQAKAAMRRGAMGIGNFIGGALDLSSVGISFIINAFVYFFTFSWINLEMIYGRWFTKGKSRFVSPLSWDPIPMPIDKNAVILSVVVVAADIALALAVVMFGIGGTCLLHDVVMVTSSTTTEAVVIGSSIAQGQSGGLCMGGIIASMFSL